MADNSPLLASVRRLEEALAILDDAIERREDEARRKANLEVELHRVGADRSRLATALDAAEGRSARLDEASREVSRRLVAAMESVRAVIERQRGGG